MKAKNYNDFCKSKECKHYIEWKFGGEKLVSCALFGKTNEIYMYPMDCVYIKEIETVEIE